MTDLGELPTKIALLVVDEQALLRLGISAYLNSQPDMVVCAEAGSLSDARSKIAEYQPQVLVTALRLGTGDSLQFFKRLKTEAPGLRILVYSALDERVFAERALRAGANGYVMKQAPRDQLATAIREVARGGIYVSREVALSAYRKSLQRQGKNGDVRRTIPRVEVLSDREIHVLQLLGSGLGPRDIAESLRLSVKTVETHQENMKHKLQLSSCAHLRECAEKWVERSLGGEEHLFHGKGRRKRERPSKTFRLLPAFDSQQAADSPVALDTAATARQSSATSPVSYAIQES